MAFAFYSVGCMLVIGGLTYGAYLMHVPARRMVVGSIELLGLGILTGVQATRQKDPG